MSCEQVEEIFALSADACIELFSRRKQRPTNFGSRFDAEVCTAAMSFVNIAMPVLSGRNFRILRWTDEYTYQQYVKYCEEKKVGFMKKTTFITFLKQFRIHRTKDESICKICSDVTNVRYAQHKNKISEKRS
eukprot:Pompholyxophrys_sp_v1_NODE_77_length_2346_cov_4.460733.p3 type:complete len:132 gc:universal NODE_77_length_2346_cov_4.460733:462-857(+)